MPLVVSTVAQVIPDTAATHLLHDAVVPGAAVSGGAIKYPDTRLAARLARVTSVNDMEKYDVGE